MEFHHPPNSPRILEAIPESQDRHTGFPFDRGFFFICFWDFVGLGFHKFHRSIINQLRHWHWRDATIRASSLSRTDISPTVGEEGEDEDEE